LKQVDETVFDTEEEKVLWDAYQQISSLLFEGMPLSTLNSRSAVFLKKWGMKVLNLIKTSNAVFP
jgi:hypothetical protein